MSKQSLIIKHPVMSKQSLIIKHPVMSVSWIERIPSETPLYTTLNSILHRKLQSFFSGIYNPDIIAGNKIVRNHVAKRT